MRLLLVLVMCWVSAAIAEEPMNPEIFEEAPGAAPCSKLAVHLYHCKPYSCTTAEGIRHAIRGYTPDGFACRHLQTLPDETKVIDCKYSPPMQAIIAKLQVAGKNDLSLEEKALMSETFERECDIRDLGEITGG